MLEDSLMVTKAQYKSILRKLITEENVEGVIEVLSTTPEYLAPGARIRTPNDSYDLLMKIRDKRMENFACMYLDGSHQVISFRILSVGILNKTFIHPREILGPALELRAASIIIAHNHPSGSVDPSPEDDDITQRIKQASDIMGITLLDHMIVAKRNEAHYSYLARGRL